MIPPGIVSHSQVFPAAAVQISVSSNLTPTRNGFFFAKIENYNDMINIMASCILGANIFYEFINILLINL